MSIKNTRRNKTIEIILKGGIGMCEFIKLNTKEGEEVINKTFVIVVETLMDDKESNYKIVIHCVGGDWFEFYYSTRSELLEDLSKFQ